jgi:hypothetical protein
MVVIVEVNRIVLEHRLGIVGSQPKRKLRAGGGIADDVVLAAVIVLKSVGRSQFAEGTEPSVTRASARSCATAW